MAPLRQRRRGDGPGWVALDVAVMFADDREAIADVAVRATPTGQVRQFVPWLLALSYAPTVTSCKVMRFPGFG